MLHLRKWGFVLIAVYVRDAFQSQLLALTMTAAVFVLLIRWKPFASESGQFEARVANGLVIVLEVRISHIA